MISATKRHVLDLYGQGRKHYKLMEFRQAAGLFQQALDIDPQDGPSKVYLERCQDYIQNPPPEDWDGVYVMKTK